MAFKSLKPSDIFQCTQCGKCCKGYGGTYVTEEDIIAIADYINADHETFKDKFCVFSGSRPLLAQKKDGYCVFWDELCTIHPVKPRMCRDWPFINAIVVDPRNWSIMGGSCPGIRTDIPDQIVLRLVKERICQQESNG